MPDDSLFDDDKPSEGDKPVQQQQQAPPAQIDLSPLLNEIKTLGNRLGTVEQYLQSVTEQNTPQPTPSNDDDLATRLLTDPKGVLSEEFKANAKEVLGPVLGNIAEDRKTELIGQFKQQIDETFGDGTWTDEFQPEVDKALEKLPPEMMSRGHLSVMVNAIKGDRFEKLVERGAKLEEAEEARAAESAKAGEPPTMLGPGYRPPETPTFSQDLKEWCAEVSKATGEKITPDEWQKLAAKGNTEDDWREEEAKK